MLTHYEWNIFNLLNPYFASLVVALSAIACGALLGFERETKSKPAGLKTMTLVSLGSSIFTVLSHLHVTPSGDGTRIAAQIVSGVGFLGAGAIFRGEQNIKGMTTAATIWVSAAIGMVAGFGFPLVAGGLSLLIYGILRWTSTMELKFAGPCQHATLELTYRENGGRTRVLLGGVLDDSGVPLRDREWRVDESGHSQLILRFCHTHKAHRSILRELAGLGDVVHLTTKELP